MGKASLTWGSPEHMLDMKGTGDYDWGWWWWHEQEMPGGCSDSLGLWKKKPLPSPPPPGLSCVPRECEEHPTSTSEMKLLPAWWVGPKARFIWFRKRKMLYLGICYIVVIVIICYIWLHLGRALERWVEVKRRALILSVVVQFKILLHQQWH